MRLPVEQVQQAILHSDRQVREAAVYYFARSYSPDPTIMPLAIQAIERHGQDAFETYSFLTQLAQSEQTVAWLIREIERVGEVQRETHYATSLVAALQHADAALLERHESALDSMHNLDDESRKTLVDRVRASSLSPSVLWKELVDFCEAREQQETISDFDYAFATSVVDALAHGPNPPVERVLGILAAGPGEIGSCLEPLAVQLAGKLKAETSIPHIVDRLAEPGTWLCEEAHPALARIGSDGVVRELARCYPAADWGFRVAIGCTLEDIHTDLAVRTSLDLLDGEQDEVIRAALLQAVLMNFAQAGFEPARQHVLKTPKDPDVLEVRSALLVACRLMNETFPEFQAWQEDSQHDVEFRRQWYRDHPIGLSQNDAELGASEVGMERDDLADDGEPSLGIVRRQLVGRNDPCPCGSGKKFKKCCYGKGELLEETDEGHAAALGGIRKGRTSPRYPIGTIALYGPDGETTTKIVASAIARDGAEPMLRRWVGSQIMSSSKTQRQIKEFFEQHHVSSVVVTEGNIGCPHEEGEDFPAGGDCPFCAWWVGKQGSSRR